MKWILNGVFLSVRLSIFPHISLQTMWRLNEILYSICKCCKLLGDIHFGPYLPTLITALHGWSLGCFLLNLNSTWKWECAFLTNVVIFARVSNSCQHSIIGGSGWVTTSWKWNRLCIMYAALYTYFSFMVMVPCVSVAHWILCCESIQHRISNSVQRRIHTRFCDTSVERWTIDKKGNNIISQGQPGEMNIQSNVGFWCSEESGNGYLAEQFFCREMVENKYFFQELGS